MNTPDNAIVLHLTLVNPKTNKRWNCPCMIPIDCLDMDADKLTIAYGSQLVTAFHDLLQHKAARKDFGKLKIKLVSGDDSENN